MYKTKNNLNKNGFTLIELLSVIIIIGVISIIAIPSISGYISNSRKVSYVTTASQYIESAKALVETRKFPISSKNITYYIPTSCIPLEKGGDSPYGTLEEGYVVVANAGNKNTYFFTSMDSLNMGIPLTNENELNADVVQSDITVIDTSIGIGNRTEIYVYTSDCVLPESTIAATNTIPDYGPNNSNGNLYNELKLNATPDNKVSAYLPSGKVDLSKPSSDTNGKGLYMYSNSTDSTYPVYYFRGNINNNNIIFAGFCWKMVRTTETGGIKILYNGKANAGKCTNTGSATHIATSVYNTSHTDNAYVGYMYGTPGSTTYEQTHANVNDSAVKKVIDKWYEDNLISYASRIEDTVWCNDRSISNPDAWQPGIKNNYTLYGANARFWSTPYTATLECANPNDRFTVGSKGNGKLTYPIALLSADEVVLAGHKSRWSNSQTYLYNGLNWWTMTPDATGGIGATVFPIHGADGGLIGYAVNAISAGVRPAISLKNNTNVVSGDGSAENPYVVK